MKFRNGRFELESKDVLLHSNYGSNSDYGKKLSVILLDEVKQDYARIKSIADKPNSCDYVILIGNIKTKKTEIWLIEEKNIICKLIQLLKNMKSTEKEVSETKYYETFIEIIQEYTSRVMYDFVYSSIILCDILSTNKIPITELSDKRRCTIKCLIVYSTEPVNSGYCDEQNYKMYQDIIRLFISSLSGSIFKESNELISELTNT
jgi:hypothetical protein